jgi:hypothetical protein
MDLNNESEKSTNRVSQGAGTDNNLTKGEVSPLPRQMNNDYYSKDYYSKEQYQNNKIGSGSPAQ